ncbi:MAG: hypothetical protein JWP50_1946 [Phenylobacterium sp.]|nr:hypothetical protein [Phenylobacterium sp.]
MVKAPLHLPRFCVFCGGDPRGGNKEHVVPRWLIELTGDPKREVFLGFDQRGYPLSFAFDQFKFPACEACNDEHAKLEDAAKRIVLDLLARRMVLEHDLSTFMDWLDKVRTGLWLADVYLGRNAAGIQPHFHIANRIGVADRMAYLSYVAAKPGLTLVGSNTPLFSIMPCAMGLYINGLAILSVSTDDLISRAVGFPYAQKRWALPRRMEHWRELWPGTGEASRPLHSLPHRLPALRLHQPMFGRALPAAADLYDRPYVREHCLDWDKGVGRVFVEGRSGLRCGQTFAHDYSLGDVNFGQHHERAFGAAVMEQQMELVKSFASLARLPPPLRREPRFRAQFSVAYAKLARDAYLEGRIVGSMEELRHFRAMLAKRADRS